MKKKIKFIEKTPAIIKALSTPQKDKTLGEQWRRGYETGVKETREKIFAFIDRWYLSYCRTHNGCSYCKNCGLDMDELEGMDVINKTFK